MDDTDRKIIFYVPLWSGSCEDGANVEVVDLLDQLALKWINGRHVERYIIIPESLRYGLNPGDRVIVYTKERPEDARVLTESNRL